MADWKRDKNRCRSERIPVLFVKHVCWILCIIGFITNAWLTLMSYHRAEKIVTVLERDVDEQGIELPSLAICNNPPFKDPQLKVMLTLEDYEANTVNPNEYILDIDFNEAFSDRKENTSLVNF